MDTLRRAKFIEAKANEAIDKTGQTMPPINLDAIAAHYGIPVRRGDRDDSVAAHFDPARNSIVLGEFALKRRIVKSNDSGSDCILAPGVGRVAVTPRFWPRESKRPPARVAG